MQNHEFPGQNGLAVVLSAMNGCFRLQEKTLRCHRFDDTLFKSDLMPIVHLVKIISWRGTIFLGLLQNEGHFFFLPSRRRTYACCIGFMASYSSKLWGRRPKAGLKSTIDFLCMFEICVSRYSSQILVVQRSVPCFLTPDF